MKKKNRLDKLLHSVFGNHSDDENSEALPNREEIDKNVEKILKMLQTQESGSISSESSFDKFELASLIDGFHKRYQVVQCRYDHLIGKLKKEIRSDSNDNGSFSVDFTSSDSEDSDSGSEELSDKGKLENMKMKNIELETMIIEMSAKLKAEKTSAAELTENAKLLRTEMDVLRTELEVSRKKEEDMNQKAQNLYEENDSLRSENAEAFCKIHEANKSLKEFQFELNQIKDEMDRVKSENNTLKEELERTSNEVASLNQQLITTNEEKETLRSGNFEFLRRTEEAEKALAALRDDVDQKLKSVEDLTSQNTHLTSENEELKHRLDSDSDITDKIQPDEKAIDDLKAGGEQQGNDTSQLQEKSNDLTLELEVTNFQLHDLNRELSAAKEEKNALSLEVSEILTKLKQSESKREELENERAHLREKISTWHQYQSKVQEAEKIINDLRGKVEQLTADNSQLKTNGGDLSVELEASKLQLIDTNKTEMRNLEVSSLQQAETEVRNLENDEILMAEVNSMLHRSLHEAELNDLSLEMEAVTSQLIDPIKVTEASEEENTSLTSEIETLKVELGKLQEANAILEQKQKELRYQKIHLEEKLGEKEKERSDLQESYKDVLKKLELTIKEKADKERENAKLYKRAENFEVQLRLSNQMIKITETECNEKIEEYKQAMEEMVEDRKEMEDHMLKICIKMNHLENELRHFKGFAEYGIPDLIRRYNELDSAFVINSSHILKKIYMFSEEMKVMKKWVMEMKNEKQELLVRVKYQEGIITIMKDEMESIVDKLVNKEKEVSVLRAHVIESEERMKVLEEMMRDKKKEVFDKDEAKREAIRQLCLLIDYHRENNDHLRKYLSSVLKSKRR